MKITYLSKLLSVEGQPTRPVSAQTCLGVFFIRSVSDTIFAVAFSSETLVDRLAERG
jgi:hypothetical protein